MPGWQRFYEQYRGEGFEVLSVSVDIRGKETVREWHEKSNCTFKTLVDIENTLAKQYHFKFVPNAFFYDENGIILAKLILFWINNPKHYRLLEQFVKGTLPSVDRVEYDATVPNIPLKPHNFNKTEQQLYEKRLRSGVQLKTEGKWSEAAKEWRKALAMDPTNYVLRCQIWGLEYPERFYPEIDTRWQEEQLARELIAEGIFNY